MADKTTASTEALSEIQQMIATQPVVIYSKSWCPYCAQCKAVFDEMSQSYTAIELDERDDGVELQAALLQMTQQRTVPNVFVGGQHLGGNDDTQQAARSGKLGALLEAPLSGAISDLEGRIVPTGRDRRATSAAPSAAPGSASAASVAGGAPAGFDPVATVMSALFPAGKGSKIAWGVLQQAVEPAAVPSDEERARRRDAAAAQLVNIDGDERERRKRAGLAFLALSAALAGALLATGAGAAARGAVAPPLFLAVGFLASWREGL